MISLYPESWVSIQNSEHIVCHGRNFYLIVMLLCRSLEIYFPKTMHSSDVKLHYWLSNEIMLTGPDDDKNGKTSVRLLSLFCVLWSLYLFDSNVISYFNRNVCQQSNAAIRFKIALLVTE